MNKNIKRNSVIFALVLAFSFVPFFGNINNASAATVKAKAKPSVVSVSMTASNFAFTPSVINAKLGDTVKVTLTGADAKHSFALSAFHINTKVNPGQTKTFSFKATKKGTFTFKCGVPCGEGHKDMTGTVVVS
ncbi:MAG: cupredoxin domain-containing protein [bacterium]